MGIHCQVVELVFAAAVVEHDPLRDKPVVRHGELPDARLVEQRLRVLFRHAPCGATCFIESCEVPDAKKMPVILEIDKLKKIGIDAVEKELKGLGVSNAAVKKLMEILGTPGSNFEKLEKMKELVDNRMAADGIKEMEEMLSYLDEKNVVLNLALARGLAYYTGPVFEVFMKDIKLFGSSLVAGGRWDKMIGQFLGAKKDYPAAEKLLK